MATKNSWEGFAPDASPLPETPKKSPQEQLDEVVEQINSLEDKREELLYEVTKEEVREDEDFLEEVHKGCLTEEAVDIKIDEAREDAEQDAEEAWQLLREFGGHAPPCLSGALVGSRALHPLCTCGWNEVATRLERT